MDPEVHLGQRPIAEGYRLFAEREAAPASPVYADWAQQVSTDPEVLALLAVLPPGKRQPNLVFAATRWHGSDESYESFRATLIDHWEQVRTTILARSTQTNEAARCATLLPFLAELPQPLALLEVGAAAGLCLLPDHYSYRYDTGLQLDPAGGPSPVLIESQLGAGVPTPRMPQVAWRAGIDLNPIDPADPDARAWLETLIWPGQQVRRDRLGFALDIAARQRPQVVAGDLGEALGDLAAQAPAGATLVVFHSAVLAYLHPTARTQFVAAVQALPGHWISNEGPTVLPTDVATATDDGRFLLMVDGVPRARTDPHGAAVVSLD